MSLDKIIDIADELGWGVEQRTQHYPDGSREDYIEFSQGSPAGEDFSFYVFYDEPEDIVRGIYEYWQDFSVEEHVTMWLDAKRNGVSGVPDAVTLVDDAREIEKMLQDLWEAENEVQRD